MIVKELIKILKDCKEDTEVVVFVNDEIGYRPFKNITVEVFNKGSSLECVHLDVDVFKEFRSVHFPNNLSQEEYECLIEKRNMLLEELEDIESELNGGVIRNV